MVHIRESSQNVHDHSPEIPPHHTLKTLTSSIRSLGRFPLGDNSIWSFPLFLPLAITAFRGPEGYFSPIIIAFKAFELILPKYYDRSGNMDKRSLDSLI